MEGNPVWSNPNYSCKLVATLPSLVKLDQQDVTQVIINQSSLLIYLLVKAGPKQLDKID